MNDLIGWLLSSDGFMPHGHCYLWQPGTLWLNVGSDGMIAGAYYAIPFALYYFVRERRAEIPYPGIVLMFAAFILLCGTTHLMEIWTVWHPDYRLAGALKAMTGVVSVLTTLALLKVIPEALMLRSPMQLQSEVEQRTLQLALVNEQLRAQVSARASAEVQLRQQDKLKDEFLATLAHELRNPLAPIRHAIKVLDGSGDGERQRKARDIINRQAQRMALLLDDLLDVSRITRGRLVLKKEPVAVAALIETALETVHRSLEERGHALTLDLPKDNLTILVDPLRLSQAISNLLTNATKFTAPGGRIAVQVRQVEDGLEFLIRDSGVGFDPARAGTLFEMFSHTQDSQHASEGGLGIGLSLVKGLVELHGGSVKAMSPGVGQGAQFSILLPRESILPPQASTTSAALPLISPAPPGSRVLIVDDNRDAADAMAALLELSGYVVTIANSGAQALEVANRNHPDAVVLDIGMPDMNGYEVARAIREQPWGRRAFMVAVTGWGQATDKQQALDAGFDLHLTKPVAPDALEAILREGLEVAPDDA